MLWNVVRTGDDEHRERLQQVRAAAKAARNGEALLQSVAVAAVNAGTPAAHVARAAEIGRATLYRWIEKAS
jgi:DNA invertase Pin-like site-specific DNA recombinase